MGHGVQLKVRDYHFPSFFYKNQKDENSKLEAKAKAVTTLLPKTEPQGYFLFKGLPTWRTTKFGATTKDPEMVAKFTWCPHHGNKAKYGAQTSMYMPSDHDHTQ